MAGLEQTQTPQECVDQWFDLLSEKEQWFPEFDEALKNKLLDEAATSFSEAGMSPQQITDTISMWFPEDTKADPFYRGDVEWVTVFDVLSEYGDYYEWVDLEKTANVITSVYGWYEAVKWKYVEEYNQIERDAHQGAIDCHLDVNREILQDYQRRIREYCEEQEIPKIIENELIETIEKSTDSLYGGNYEYTRDNFEDVKDTMLTQINDIGKRWMWVYSASFTDEQLIYLHWIWVALVRASLDDIESKRDK